ncbi:E7 [Anas platyrhynchos papillomavirus 2]|nr:E7 [Anas platyrhynchos papillomavirus 2]
MYCYSPVCTYDPYAYALRLCLICTCYEQPVSLLELFDLTD